MLYDGVIYADVRQRVRSVIDQESSLPLPPHMFFVLLVLNAGPSHGYGIKKAVAVRSGGTVDLDAGGMYRLIARLEERGWAEPAQPAAGEGGDARRKYYGLTEAGREILAAEARRVSALASQPDVVALALGSASG